MGLYFSGKYSAEGLCEAFNLDDETKEHIGHSCGIIVALVSAPIKAMAEKINLVGLYDLLSGYNPDGLNMESLRKTRTAAAIKSELIGLIMSIPKVTLAAMAMNGGLLFHSPAPLWQNIAVLAPLGVADGSIFNNNFQKRYNEMLEQVILKACKPDAESRFADFRKKPGLMRDVLRISTKKAIAAVEKLPDHSLMALVDELYPTGAPWNEGVELEQMP